MKFRDFLLRHYELIQDSNRDSVSSVCTHSEDVQPHSLFIALHGKTFDAHDYLEEAVQKGAGILLVRQTEKIPSHFKGMVLKYSEDLKDLSPILNQFYDFPSEKLFTVGVTGTNGKTSFCYLLEHILLTCGWRTAVMGTVNQRFEKKNWPAPLTTPDPARLFQRLNDFVQLGAQALLMEVSSIALDQNRVEGVDFDALVFSNLTQDHLDYHGSMENYFSAKEKLFLQKSSSKKKSFCLINQDDSYGKILKKRIRGTLWTYGKEPSADFCFQIKNQKEDCLEFELKSAFGREDFSLPLIGEYNVYNAVSALSTALLIGFKVPACKEALKSFPGIPGRLERVWSSKDLPFKVFIDYAHSPSALAEVLQSLRSYSQKIILVFGCGGDRDKEKRPLMISSALKGADQIFLTSDNPRREDPVEIIEDSLKSFSKKEMGSIHKEPDRKEAIRQAIQMADKGDLVLIAGKGHEAFQIVGNKKIPFSDREVARKCLQERF